MTYTVEINVKERGVLLKRSPLSCYINNGKVICP